MIRRIYVLKVFSIISNC